MAIRNISVLLSANVGTFQSKFRTAAATINNFQKQINALSGSMGSSFSRINGSAGAASNSIHNFNRGLGVGVNQFGRFNAAGTAGSRAMAAMAGQTTLAGKAMSGLSSYAKDTISVFGGFLAINTAIRGITQSLQFAVDAFMNFDQQMTESKAIMGELTDTMENDLQKAVFDVAKTTTFSADEAAEGLYYIASAGFDATSSLEALPVAAKFAQAGMLDLADSTEYLLDITNAFGMVDRQENGLIDVEPTIDNMERVSDVITKAAIDSNATIDQLAAALTNKAAGASRLLGIEIEETTAAMEAFASVGVKGQVAGTQYAMVVRDLQKVAQKSSAEMKALGIDVFDANGEFNSLSTIIIQMSNALGTMSDQQKRSTLTMLGFQDRSLGALMSLLGLGEEMKRYEAGLRGAAGATEEVAGKQLESFKNQITLLRNQLGIFSVETIGAFIKGVKEIWGEMESLRDGISSVASGVLPSLITGVDVITDSFKVLAGVAGVAGNALGSLFGFIGGIGPVMAVVGAMLMKNLIIGLGSRLPGAAMSGRMAMQGLNAGMSLARTGMRAVGDQSAITGLKLVGLSMGMSRGSMAALKFGSVVGTVGAKAVSAATGVAAAGVKLQGFGRSTQASAAQATRLSGVFSGLGTAATWVGTKMSTFGLTVGIKLNTALTQTGFGISRLQAKLSTFQAQVAGTTATTGLFNKAMVGMARNADQFVGLATTGLFLFVTQWQSTMADAKASAEEFNGAMTEDLDWSNFSSIVENYNEISKVHSEVTDEMNAKWEGPNPWDTAANRTSGLVQVWGESLGIMETDIDDLIAKENEMSETLSKSSTIIENVRGLMTNLDGIELEAPMLFDEETGDVIDSTKVSFDVFQTTIDNLDMSNLSDEAKSAVEKSTARFEEYQKTFSGVADTVVFKAGEMAGIDWSNPDLELTEADWEALKENTELVAGSIQSVATDYTDLGEIGTSEMESLIERAEALDKATGEMFTNMADAAEAYKNSLIEVKDVGDIFTDSVQEETDAYNKAQDEAAEAEQKAADNRIDQLSESTDSLIKQRERQRDADIAAIEASAADGDDATKAAADSRVQQVRDAYDAEIDGIRKGSEEKQDVIREAANAERERLDEVLPTATAFVEDIEATSATYSEYLDKIDQLAAAGASTELIDVFRNMKPEQGQALIDEILSNTGEFVDRYNTAISDLGKVENTPSWETFQAQIEGRQNDIASLGGSMLELAEVTGLSFDDVRKVAVDMDKAGMDVTGTFAGLRDQLNQPGGAQNVKALFVQWKNLAESGIPEAGQAFGYALKALDAQAKGDMDTLIGIAETMSPEEFVEAMLDMGLAEEYSAQMVELVTSTWDVTEEDYYAMLARMKDATVNWTIDVPRRAGQLAGEAIRERIGQGVAGIFNNTVPQADGSVLKFFANGGMENHVAQIAPAGSMRVWAEPETGGEAYIPLAQSKRFRSTDILATVASMFGYSLTPFAMGGLYGAAATAVPAGQPNVVVVPVTTTNQTNFNGDIHGANFDEIRAKALRKQRQRNLINA